MERVAGSELIHYKHIGCTKPQGKKTSWELVAALKQCSKRGDLISGKKLHKEAITSGSHTNKYVATALIDMYSKCGSMSLAREAFNEMSCRDGIAWTCLILGYIENRENMKAIETFSVMDSEPDSTTFVAAVKACVGLASQSETQECGIRTGVEIHKRLKERDGLDTTAVVGSALVDMYRKYGRMTDAREVFERIVDRNVYAWNSMILGYVDNGETSAALRLLSCMDCEPDSVTFVAACKSYASLATSERSRRDFCMRKAESIRIQVKQRGFDRNVIVSTALLELYCKCGDMTGARDVFENMVKRNVVTWNCLLMGYVDNGQSKCALDMFGAMDCQPDSVTFVAVLKACSGLEEKHVGLQQGTAIHRQLEQLRLESNLVVSNTLLGMYCKCLSIDSAKAVFEKMPRKDIVTWNCLILGYVENKRSLAAIEVFKRMNCQPDSFTFVAVLKACACLASEKLSHRELCLETGMRIHAQVRELGFESNVLVTNALLDMYCKCQAMERAKNVFDKMLQQDVVSWNCLILGYAESGQTSLALELFMIMDCEPERATVLAALKACGSLASLEAGQIVHARACKLGLESEEMVATSVVDLYGKCGTIAAAEQVFNGMPSPSIVSWNALLAGHTTLGNSTHVFTLARRIREAGLQMTGITFICILTACSHAGMVDEGRKYFNSMSSHYGLSPGLEHYTCLVDMLGRANRLEEASLVAKSIPFQVEHSAWKSMLGACRNDSKGGRLALELLQQHTSVSNQL